MTARIELLQNLLWFAHPVLQTVVAVVMVRGKLHRKFPVFFIYAISQVAIFAFVYSSYRLAGYEIFFYTYWACEAASLGLGFKVIHEVFLDVFRPYHTLKDLGTIVFKWATLVMLLVAAVVAASSPPSIEGPLVQAVLTISRCVRVTQVGLILFLMVFSRYLGVSWRQRSFGIALGFGIFAAVELLLVALLASNNIGKVACDLSNMVAYNIAIFVWIGYMVFQKAERQSPVTLLTSQRWDESLSDIQRPEPVDSLIPMFEGMVERALSRPEEGKPEKEKSKAATTGE